MKNSLIAIAFAVASMPMFAQSTPAQTPAQSNPPSAEKPAKTKKAPKTKHAKKSSKKNTDTTTPVQK